jgi:hypothetical protein
MEGVARSRHSEATREERAVEPNRALGPERNRIGSQSVRGQIMSKGSCGALRNTETPLRSNNFSHRGLFSRRAFNAFKSAGSDLPQLFRTRVLGGSGTHGSFMSRITQRACPTLGTLKKYRLAERCDPALLVAATGASGGTRSTAARSACLCAAVGVGVGAVGPRQRSGEGK